MKIKDFQTFLNEKTGGLHKAIMCVSKTISDFDYVTNDGMWAAIPYGKQFIIIHNGCQVKVLNTYKQSVDFINNQKKTIKKKSRK